MRKRRVAIVGGGISGIAAALELNKTDWVEAHLLEATSRLGGVIETIRDGQFLIERGADNFSTLIPHALELSKEHGLGPGLIRPNPQGRQAFVLIHGRVYPIPAGFSLMQPTRLLSMILTRTLTWRGKLRLLAEFWVPPKLADRQFASGEMEDESLESFATRRLGKEAFERLVEPIVGGIFTADSKTLSMAASMPQFLEMERSYGGLIRGYLAARRKDAVETSRRASGARYDSFVAPIEGMSHWVQRLAECLPKGCVHTDSAVARMMAVQDSAGPAKWQMELQTASSTSRIGSDRYFDGVILATPAATSASLLRGIAPEASSLVGSIPYASSAVVAMIVAKKEISGRLDGFGIVIPRREGRVALAISYTSNKYPGRVPEDHLLVRVFLGGALRPSVVDWSEEELCKVASSELRSIVGWMGDVPKWQGVFRWKHAMPQYLVGHANRIQELHQSLEKFPTLRLCGAAYQGVGIPQCVRSGQFAARELLSVLQACKSA